MADERRIVHYEGRVQGVGFRASVQQVARGFAVTGFVRNLAGGEVELVAEGTRGELEAFLEKVADAMEGCITNVRSTAERATGEFAGFKVRF